MIVKILFIKIVILTLIESYFTIGQTNLEEEVYIIRLNSTSHASLMEDTNSAYCNRFDCFISLSCELTSDKQLLYYIYPPVKVFNENSNSVYDSLSMMSREYRMILDTIQSSVRHTTDPKRACIFVPSIDLAYLSHLKVSTLMSIYYSLPYWRSIDQKPGTNHMIISLEPTFSPSKIIPSIGHSALVSTNHDTWSLRPQFDLNIPFINENLAGLETSSIERGWKLIFTQYGSTRSRHRNAAKQLETLMGDDFLILGHHCPYSSHTISSDSQHNTTVRCSLDREKSFVFPEVLASSSFCLILHLNNVPLEDTPHYLLTESLRHGCIPIISSDFILPFGDDLIWEHSALLLTNSDDFSTIPKILSEVSEIEYIERRKSIAHIWYNYFVNYSRMTEHILRHYDTFVYPKLLLSGSAEL